MPFELMRTLVVLVPFFLGLALVVSGIRWLWRSGSKAGAPAAVDTRPLAAELEGTRLRMEELERRLEQVEERSAFVERLLEKPRDDER